jgi:hypothetical protein
VVLADFADFVFLADFECYFLFVDLPELKMRILQRCFRLFWEDQLQMEFA